MRKMKRLKWVHDKKIRMEKPDQGGPRDSGFAQCRVVTCVAAVLKHQPSKLAISSARTGLKLESCHATAPTIWKNKTDLNRGLDPSTLYANHKVVSGVDTRAMQSQTPKAMRGDVSENGPRISRLGVRPHLAQPSFWKIIGKQDGIRSRLGDALSHREREQRAERVKPRAPFYNHSAMQSSVNKVQTS